MLKSMSRGRMASWWFTSVAIAAAGGIVLRPDFTVGTGMLLIAASLVPPLIMLFVWRGGPEATIAEVLHDTDSRPSL